MKNISLILIITVLAFSVSCKQGKKSSSDNSDASVSGINKTQVEKDVREFVYPLPTAFEVTEMLQRINAAFILTITNPVSNVERYLTESSKAINLGIYGTDLSYAATYNQKQEVVNYMNICKTLIDELNISGAITPEIINQVEQNQDNKDFLVNLVTNTFYDAYELLCQSGRGSSSMLVVAGSWVEALYIATHISISTFDNKEMVNLIVDQKQSLEKLISLMESMSDDDAVTGVVKQLSPIRDIYNSIDGNISKTQLDNITKEILAVRTQMIQ